MLSALQVRERAAALSGADPAATLAWAVEAFPGKVALTVSFGGGGVVLAHLISRIDRSVPVIFLDTRFHFRETYEFKRRFAKRYRLNLVELTPLTDPGPLYKTDPNRCCFLRKVEPLERTIVAYDAWISAVRQDQSDSRRGTELVEIHEVKAHSIAIVCPLARRCRHVALPFIRDNSVP